MALTFAKRVLRADPTAQISITTGPKADTVPAELAASGQVICDPPTAALDPEPWIDLGLHEGPRGPVRLYASKETVRNTNAVRSAPLGTLSPSNSYFGRETELAGVAALLSGERRLVTLTGPGGMGKTRLSQEVARIVAPVYPSGVVFVRLEDIFLGQQIWDAIASALKIVANPNSPVQEQVIAVMQGGRWLLVLDNFEQLCDAGGPDVVNTILQTLPETSILVSSRRRLAVEGEVESPLPPLPSPDGGDDLETLARSPSVALFLDRARSARPDFQLTASNRADVVSLCERLDGIPLALELAAARAQVLTPGQILDRFDQRLDILTSRAKGERHKSLRNAIDWTYSMLPDDLQTAFRRLSVFRGGWDEQAAETVLDSPVTLDLLADLREVSLVSSFEDSGGAMRFHMLETLRDYARKAADEAEWSESRERHCRAFVDRVEHCESKLEGKEQVAVLNGLEADRANIAAAVEWAIENSKADLALRICAAAWRFWHLKSHISEGRSLCRAALAIEGGGAVLRARAMNGNGRLAYLQGDYEESRTLHQEAIRLGGHEPTVRAMSLNALGAVAYETGQYPEAVRLFEESLDIRRQIGDEFGIGNVLSWLGIVYTDQSRYDDARRVLEESLDVRERIGDVSGTARALNSLGIVARRLTEWKTASDCYERALEIQRQMGDRRAIAGLLSNLGMIAQSSGDTERAVELFQESQRINVELGDKWGTATVLANQASLALEAGDLSRSLELNGEALRLRHEIGNQWGIAYSMEGCAQALLAAGRPQEGAKALGCAAKVRAAVGSPLPPVDQRAVDETTERIKAEVGETRFDESFSAGRSASVDESVAQILASLLS